MNFSVMLRWLIFLISLGFSLPVVAQPITPANSGTGTTVKQSGKQFDIGGGTLSGDAKNLFHDFDQFGLNQGQIANFLSQPNIENILGRVGAGEASFINGLLQVTGGNSNLYLMNPAGIHFGESASLNVAGDFTATTATGIGFGDNNWLSAFGDNDYSSLVGTPTQFIFDVDKPQSITNKGDLVVTEGQSLNLFAGNVENSGTLMAKSGQINIQAIADKNVIKLSQDGSLLNLKIDTTKFGDKFSAANLPELLTGAGKTKIAGKLDVSGNVGGEVKILGETVSLENATIDASGINGGGNIFVGGDKQGLGDLPTAQNLLVDENTTITASALKAGNGGQIIVFSEENGELRGAITARGGKISGNGGFVETSALGLLTLTSTVDAGATNGIGGEWLIDPTNITIENGGSGGIGTNTVGVDLINTALNTGTSVTLDTSAGGLAGGLEDGNITQNVDAIISKTAGGEATLRYNADNSIFINGTISSTSNKLNVIFNSDRDGLNGGAIALENAQISSNGGGITLGGGSNPLATTASGTSTNINGAFINNTILNADSGDINIVGAGFLGGATDNTYGIQITGGSTLQTASSGSINLNGAGGLSTVGNDGIIVRALSLLRSVDGDINLTGSGNMAATTASNEGITIINSTLESLGNGSIFLDGSGGSGTDSNHGIFIEDNSNLRSINGDIDLKGQGSLNSTGVDNTGIFLFNNSTIESTGNGSITLNGVAGSGINRNDGILLKTLSIVKTNNGNITLTGKGNNSSTGISNEGISLEETSKIESTGIGSIFLDGSGGSGTDSNYGIFIEETSEITSVNGNLNLTGQGSSTSTGINNIGVFLFDNSTINSVGVGSINLNGIGGSGTNSNRGISISSNATITSKIGAINLIGQGSLNTSATDDNYGIYIQENSDIISSETADISLTGTGGFGEDRNHGIYLHDNSNITAQDTGTILLEGTGGSGNEFNHGIHVDQNSAIAVTTGSISLTGFGGSGSSSNSGVVVDTAEITSTSGAIAIEGQGSENVTDRSNFGVWIKSNSRVESTSGAITLEGQAGSGSDRENSGISFGSDSAIASVDGDISLIGTGNVNSTDIQNHGVLVKQGTISTTGNGNITFEGISGQGRRSRGVQIDPGNVVDSIAITTTQGDIAIRGTALLSNEELNNNGVGIFRQNNTEIGTAKITSTAGGNIAITGFGGGGTEGNRGIRVSSQTEIRTTGNGSINLTGTARGGTVEDNQGIRIRNQSILSSENGDINLLGRSNAPSGIANNGISIFDEATDRNRIESTGTGSIFLTGIAASSNDSAIRIVHSDLQINSGTLSLTGDELDFVGTTTLSGNGNVFLQPLTSFRAIALNNAVNDDPLVLDLNATDLGAFQNGFSQITIGRSDSSGAISLANDVSFSDPILLRSPVGSGSINTNGFDITGTDNASISLLANRNITTANITTQGQAISLLSQNGTINTGNLATTGNTGGNILVDAELAINAGAINSSGSVGSGGDVTLDPIGDIQVEYINTQGGINGVGGNVDITAGRFFRATGGFVAQNGLLASISSTGGLGDGSIIIRHGGAGFEPFVIGNGSQNGTLGGIFSTGTLSPLQSLLFPQTFGNIQILTDLDFSELLPYIDQDLQIFSTNLESFFAYEGLDRVPIPLVNISFLSPDIPVEVYVANVDQTFTNFFLEYFSSGGLSRANPTFAAGTTVVPNLIASTSPTIPSNANPNFVAAIDNNAEVSADTQQGSSEYNTVSLFSDANDAESQVDTGFQADAGSQAIAKNNSNSSADTLSSNTTSNTLDNDADSVVSSQPATTQNTFSDEINSSDASTRVTNQTEASEAEATDNSQLNSTDEIASTSPQQSSDNNSRKTDNSPASGTTSEVKTLDSETTNSAENNSSDTTPNNPSSQLSLNTLNSTSATDTDTESSGSKKDKSSEISDRIAAMNLEAVQAELLKVEKATQISPSIVHAIFVPIAERSDPTPYDQLHLVFTPPEGKPVIHKVDVTREQVEQTAKKFFSAITRQGGKLEEYNGLFNLPPDEYLQPAQKLYGWLIEPLLDDLEAQNIGHLTFSVDQGLRSLPFAALHDGEEFLVEQYSVSLMPSLALTNLEYVDIKSLDVLAMGADKFTDKLPLPAVPMELEIVSNVVWEGKSYLNDGFSTENLQAIRSEVPYRLVHLATHGDFVAGDPSQSFISFGDEDLGLHELRELGLHEPPVELMVLSACTTALGDRQAELGFAGLAVLAGVKSALGSLWYVSDTGTLGLIAEFYQQLGKQPIKSEALRQTQLAMIRGEIEFESGSLITSNQAFPLPATLEKMGDRQLTHPYYWSAFTIIGNPW